MAEKTAKEERKVWRAKILIKQEAVLTSVRLERSPVERSEEGMEVALFLLDRWVTLALPCFANVIFMFVICVR